MRDGFFFNRVRHRSSPQRSCPPGHLCLVLILNLLGLLLSWHERRWAGSSSQLIMFCTRTNIVFKVCDSHFQYRVHPLDSPLP